MSWHLERDALASYAAGRADPASAASAEAHLLGCDVCRATVSELVDPARLARTFADIVDRLDCPSPGPVERLLRAVGVRETTARVLAAAPALRASWLLSTLLVLVFAVAFARVPAGGDGAFVLAAPLLPLLGVALCYGPGVDPAYDITAATPYSGLRLLFLRASAVLATTSAFAVVAGLFLPRLTLAGAWLLPGLALAVVSLACATVMEPLAAAALVGAGWLVTVVLAARWQLDAVGATGQLVCLLLLVAGAIVVGVRRERFERGVAA